MDPVMKGRGGTKADAAKVAGGAVAGALVGKLLGKNTKGAVIGGAAGAAAGAAAARASRDIDGVIPKGAAITIKLNKPLTVKHSYGRTAGPGNRSVTCSRRPPPVALTSSPPVVSTHVAFRLC